MCAGAVIVAGLSESPGRIVNVAGSRTFEGGAPPLCGAGFVVVSGPVGGVPVAVGVVSVVVPVLAVPVLVVPVVVVPVVVVPVVVRVVDDADEGADAVGDLPPEGDDPHPTGVMSNTSPKRTADLLTFAG